MLRKEELISYGIHKIISYVRKSRQDVELEKRTGEDTLAAQIALMKRVLDPLELEYDLYQEIGSGDKIETRPIFQHVIEELKSGKYQAIAVKELSRMGRGSYTDMGQIYDLITKNNIYIITPHKLYNPSNSADTRQIRFELFLSREEFETIRERLTSGKINSVMSGQWVAGRSPFGYNYNKQTRKLEINEEEAKIVRLIYDLYVNGIPTKNGFTKEVSFRGLATYISETLKIKSPKGLDYWAPSVMKHFLSYPRFIGTLVYRENLVTEGKVVKRPVDEQIIIEDAIPPILDIEVWEKAQEKIMNSSKKPKTKHDLSPCELASLCICVKCGRKMLKQINTRKHIKKDGEVSIYTAESLRCLKVGCSHVKYRDVEDGLLEVLQQLKNLDEKTLEKFLNNQTEQNNKVINKTERVSLDQITAKKKSLESREEFIYEKFETGEYSPEVFHRRIEKIKKEKVEIEKLEAELMNFEYIKDSTIDIDLTKRNIVNFLELYNKLEDKTEKNKLLRSIFDCVYIEVTTKGKGKRPALFNMSPHFKSTIYTTDLITNLI